jgi:P-type conjugative transfer protein TrbJ
MPYIDSRLRRVLAASAMALSIATPVVVGAVAPAQALIVFDPSNYAQNVLQAARALEQINNQITSLANQAQMLINQARNLTNLPTSMLSEIEGNFSEMTSLMGEAQKLAYNVQNIDRTFQSTYQNFATDKTGAQLVEGARQRWQQSLSAYEDSLKAGAVAVGNIDETQSETSSLVGASQWAVGILQATQAGNQLLAVQARQVADLTAMLAAQGRADALDKSREAAAEEQGREQFSRFMSGTAYSPSSVRMFHE